MTKTRTSERPTRSSSIAGLLAWILPGLGHWYLGHRARAITIMVVIAVTFWCGVAIGGVKSTVDPKENRLWFLAQICAGSHTIAATLWSRQLEPTAHVCPNCDAPLAYEPRAGDVCPKCGRQISDPELAARTRLAFWPQVDIAIVYTGIAGLLNLLVILDAIARAELEPLGRQTAAEGADG